MHSRIFSFFFFLFFPLSLSPHHVSPRSLLSLPFLPPTRSSPARPSTVRRSFGPSTHRHISPGLAQLRSARGGARSHDQSTHQPKQQVHPQPRPTRTRPCRLDPNRPLTSLPARASLCASSNVQEPAPCRASADHTRHHIG